MSNIRDEISKVIDVRIPPNGYRKYIKTISRTGGFQQLQVEESLIALFEAVEELQGRLNIPSSVASASFVPYEVTTPTTDTPQFDLTPFVCPECKKEFKAQIGLRGHMSTHQKDEKSIAGRKTTTK